MTSESPDVANSPGDAGPETGVGAPAGRPGASGPGRRSFLRGLAVGGGVVAGGAAGAAAGYSLHGSSSPGPAAAANTEVVEGRLPAVPFHGEHQAGITPHPSPATSIISFTATAQARADLVDLFQTVTDRARFLTAGGNPPVVGIGGPPSDTGTLGATVVPDGLMITFGVGSTLFDDRYGLAARKPAHLTPMTSFPNDDLDPAQTDGDLIMQISGGHQDVVLHALRDITANTRGGMHPSWRIEGFASPARPTGTVPRNHFGFMDGIANPSPANATQMNKLVWVQPGATGEPGWTAGGSYLVVRLIRQLTEFWDRVDIYEQQLMIGRYRTSGYPLDADGIYATPDYAADPTGDVIPVNAHIRLANPRTPETASSLIMRRAWNYNRGLDEVGNLDLGLVFTCYQQDIKRQFEATQTRLINEPMIDYISPFGGGYFMALPGVRDSSDYFGRELLA
ncbi:MAG TPA: Dyp-type peroxidase [Trebonia sp.]|jgi:deferrochelatase/peroxidase EfeB|nr:Dyp-type peroxidase [Trebonia sp.]